MIEPAATNVQIDFLFRHWFEDDAPAIRALVHYGQPEESTSEHRLTVHRSSFWERPSLPESPTSSLGEVPVLFGSPKISRDRAGHPVVHADLFASAFFLLTRYEETIRSDVRDEHGRFPGKESTPFLESFLDQPVVDQYRQLILDLLKREGVDIPQTQVKPEFALVLTHDIDNPFCYLYLKKTLGISLLQTVGKRPGKPLNSIRSWMGTRPDPFDTFDWMNEQFQSARQHLGDRVRQIYFVMACENGPYDRGYTVENKRIRKLLNRLKKTDAEFGLHPSYKAGTSPDELVKEKRRLESVLEIPVTQSRHHYLRLREPSHTRRLIEAGFTDDYSAGYADVAGFRNGTTKPFYYFDLDKQIQTDFRIHPLPIMECSFKGKDYMNLSLGDAIEHAEGLAQQSIDHQGELVLLWHNPTFSEPQSSYYRPFYTQLLNFIYQQATIQNR